MNYYRIGRIMKPHGIRGAFKVFVETDFPQRFKEDKAITLEHKGERKDFPLEDVKFLNGGVVVLKVTGIESPEEATLYKNASLVIPEEELFPLDEDMFYEHELIGCRVFDGEKEIGSLKEIFFNGGTDVYVVESSEGKEIMIPAVKAFVKEINTDERTICVELIEGMME